MKRQWPKDFSLTPELREYAHSKGILPIRVEEVWEHFENYHRAKGSKFVDWARAWYTWVLNDRQFARRDQPKSEMTINSTWKEQLGRDLANAQARRH